MGYSEGSSKRKYIVIQAYLKEEEQSKMNRLNSQLMKLKKEQMRPKVSRRRDIIKSRAEINKIEKINKIDKHLARLIKKIRVYIHTHNQK